MDKIKKLTALLVVLAAVCIATILVSHHEIKKEQIKETDELILEVPSDSVTKLSWTLSDTDTTLSFTKQDDSWQSDDDATLPVDSDKIAKLLETFESFGASFIIEEPESLDQYGLDKPVCSISFTSDSKDYTVLLGGFSTMDQERYVSVGDGNVYLVSTDPYDTFNKELDYFTKTDEVPELEDAVALKFSGSLTGNGYEISYDADNAASYSDEDVYYNGDIALNSKSVRSYLKTLASLDLSDCVNHTLTDEELSQYGLDKPLLNVDISYDVTDDNGKKTGDQAAISLAIGVDPADADKLKLDETYGNEEVNAAASASTDGSLADGNRSLEPNASDNNSDSTGSDKEESEDASDDITAYIRFNDSKLVYKLSKSDYEAVTAVTKGEFNKKDLLPISFDDVDSITVALDGEEYTFTGTRKLMGGREWSYNGETLDISDIREAIEAATAADASDTTPTLKKEISLSFATQNKHHPDIHVSIYRYNGSDCIMQADDGTYQLIKRSKVVSLCEAIYAVVLC